MQVLAWGKKVGGFMGKIIAVANQKGGVGKTTTAISLSAAMAEKGKKVLLIDCDPQGNATSGFGIDKNTLSNSVYDVIIEEQPIATVIQETEFGVAVVPSIMDLAGAEVELVNADNQQFRLKKALAQVKDKYDFVIIDCPPSLSFITLNALAAADSVLMPLQCEFYALEGLSQLLNTIELVQREMNNQLVIEGLVLTMFDSRTKLSEQVEAEVRNNFADKVYNTKIPRNVRLSEAPSYGQPIFAYDPTSKGAKAYLALAEEVLAHE